MENTRTIAIQMPEEIYRRLKVYLKRHQVKQKDLVTRLVERALDEGERQAGVSPCETQPEGNGITSPGEGRSPRVGRVTCRVRPQRSNSRWEAPRASQSGMFGGSFIALAKKNPLLRREGNL